MQFILNVFVKLVVVHVDHINVLGDLLWSFCHIDFGLADGCRLCEDMPVVIAIKNCYTWVNIVTRMKIINASLHTEYSFEVVAFKLVSDGVLELG